MSHLGSCHCGRIRFEVQGELKSAMECVCTNCGCAPFGLGAHDDVAMAAINVRCLEDVDLAQIPRVAVDGRSF